MNCPRCQSSYIEKVFNDWICHGCGCSFDTPVNLVQSRRLRYLKTYPAKNAASKRSLRVATKSLVEYIWNYDSNTFFAKGEKVTRYEAMQIAAKLVEEIIESIDGVTLAEQLEILRNKE